MATNKTIQPTGTTISVPEFTDKPDARVFATDVDRITDAVNAQNDNIAKLEVLPITISNVEMRQYTTADSIAGIASVESDMVVLQSVLTTPSAQTGDWTVTTGNGTITFSGSKSGTTGITIYLMKSR